MILSVHILEILTWFNVMQCVPNELFPAMSVKLSQCVQDKLLMDSSFKMSDIGDDAVKDVLKRLMERRTMNNVEINYLKGLFQRAIQHNEGRHGLLHRCLNLMNPSF